MEGVSARRQGPIAAAVLACLFAAKSSPACVKVQGHVKVKADLVVSVHDPDGKPLSRMEIRAYEFFPKPPHSELAASAVTDKNGRAHIKLGTENYSLGAIGSGVSSEVVLVDVYDDDSGAPDISLTWPGGPLTLIQNPSGVLGTGRDRVPWEGAVVTLKSANRDFGSAVTDSHGRFEFRGIHPDFYALHISEPGANVDSPARMQGDIPIEIIRDAPNFELPTWGFVVSDCGLSAYKDAHSMIMFAP